MAAPTVHFLLVYSFDQGALIRTDEFADPHEATTAYEAAEREVRGESDKFEVVLVGADSLETVMQTHGHYFRSSSDSLFSEFLKAATPV
jgi:hypothetical protein